jgi:hypothetical protein
MQKARNITRTVSPERYRQTRRIATECDTTVPDRIMDRCRFLLVVLPDAANQARFPGGRPLYAAARSPAIKPSKCPPRHPQIHPWNRKTNFKNPFVFLKN